MAKLQIFDWKKSQYERPTHGWICGRICDDQTCGLGPTSRGVCQAAGDEKCRPKRSLMAKRWLLTVACSAVSLAFCLSLFMRNSPATMVSPGDVTHHHSTLKHDCAQCHTASADDTHWLSCVGNTEVSLENSKKCMQCHQGMGLTAHGLPESILTEITQKAKHSKAPNQTPVLANFASELSGYRNEHQIACSTCHHEHRGRHFDLKAMSNTQCQSCHERQFHAFDNGHPPFEHFPYEHRTRIYFDHARHINKHFKPEELHRLMPGNRAKSCVDCHEMSHDGQMVLTSGYDKMCASCHDAEIVDLDFPGIPAISLRDLAKRKDANGEPLKIGEWPQQFADPPLKDSPSIMKLSFLNPVNDEPAFADDVDFAWKTKQLLHDLEFPRSDGRGMTFGLKMATSPLNAVRLAQRSWFPNLSTELKARAAEQPFNLEGDGAQPQVDMKEPTTTTGWYVRDSDRTIRYRPTGHADATLKSWLNELAAFPRPPAGIDAEELPLDKSMRELWELLASPTASGGPGTRGPVASGRCLMCHSVESPPKDGLAGPMDHELRINWTARKQTKAKRLMKYSHAPHVLTLAVEGCTTCHQMTESPSDPLAAFKSNYFKQSFDGWDQNLDAHAGHSSGFQSISQAKCMKCHSSGGVSQGCLTCHNYHTLADGFEHNLRDLSGYR